MAQQWEARFGVYSKVVDNPIGLWPDAQVALASNWLRSKVERLVGLAANPVRGTIHYNAKDGTLVLRRTASSAERFLDICRGLASMDLHHQVGVQLVLVRQV